MQAHIFQRVQKKYCLEPSVFYWGWLLFLNCPRGSCCSRSELSSLCPALPRHALRNTSGFPLVTPLLSCLPSPSPPLSLPSPKEQATAEKHVCTTCLAAVWQSFMHVNRPDQMSGWGYDWAKLLELDAVCRVQTWSQLQSNSFTASQCKLKMHSCVSALCPCRCACASPVVSKAFSWCIFQPLLKFTSGIMSEYYLQDVCVTAGQSLKDLGFERAAGW